MADYNPYVVLYMFMIELLSFMCMVDWEDASMDGWFENEDDLFLSVLTWELYHYRLILGLCIISLEMDVFKILAEDVLYCLMSYSEVLRLLS